MASRFTFLPFLALICILNLMFNRASATTVEIPIDQMQKDEAVLLEHGFTISSATSALKQKAHIGANEVSSVMYSKAQASRTQPVLLLRVSFSDQDFSFRREDFHSLMFSTRAQDSSVANYYLENSYQDFLLVPAVESQGQINDGIIDVKLPYKHPNFGASYGSSSTSLVRDAMAVAQEFIQISHYDKNRDRRLDASELAIVLMIAGYENAYGGDSAPKPNVWAHKADINSYHQGIGLTTYAMFGERHQNHLATIGIISHEMGHLLFSLPDLYDRQWDSNGIGRWGLMGLGSWNSQGGYSGSSPAHMLAWSKVKAGFLKPEDVTGEELEFALASTTQGPEAMRIWLDPFRHGEHFLLEYRTKTSLDSALPGHGLLISHVDDWVGYGNGGPQNDVAEHKLVDIEEADGRQDLDQLQNRGDRQDVYNDAYGQDYFGSSSLPASLDYHGNTSGVEIYDIKVRETVSGLVTLPYQKLGDNLGYDEGGIGTAWGQASGRSESMLRVTLSSMTWLHGVDVFSHGHGLVELAIFSAFDTQGLSGKLVHMNGQILSPGWNRISFDQPVSAAGLDQVFLQLTSDMEVGRPFSIDLNGEASGRSYTKSGLNYSPANFDFNQRLLVADQAEPFSYQVPKKIDYQLDDNKTAAASLFLDWPGSLLVIFTLLALTARGKLGR
jgi:M6 family metalloprotease-like protein